MTKADKLAKHIEGAIDGLKLLQKEFLGKPNCAGESAAVRLTIRSLELSVLSIDNMSRVIMARSTS